MTNHASNLRDIVSARLHALGLSHEKAILLLAVSGGADSMAMLHVMAEIADACHYRLHVIHINHLIRKDATFDADHVTSACRQYGLAYTCTECDVPTAAKQSGQSIEMEARTQRYKAFAKVYQQIQADALLTAHTRNDQAETILLNLSRGCSPSALAAITTDTTRHGMRIIRPMLTCTREDIIKYLQTHNYAWREDLTNTDLAYRRNAIRHQILPAMRNYLNPQIDAALLRVASMAEEDEAYLHALAQQHVPDVIPEEAANTLKLPAYQQLPIPLRRRILVHWLWRQQQISASTLHYDLIQKLDALAMAPQAGKQIPLPAGKCIQHAYDQLVMRNPTQRQTDSAAKTAYPLNVPGITPIEELGCQLEISYAEGFTRESTLPPGTLPATCHIRRPQANESLWIRTRQPGDRIHMTGAEGHQKLQDIFTDKKVPSFERDRIPLLATEQELIWIPGLRIAKDWAVSAEDAPSLKIHIAPL